MSESLVKVWISTACLRFIAREFEAKYPDESGGILLGYFSSGSVVVTEAVGPGPRAKHNRRSFVPDYHYHDSVIEQRFEDSSGTIIYVGDWHTHPDGRAQLSCTDRATLKRIVKKTEIPAAIMMIVAGSENLVAAVFHGRIKRTYVANRFLLQCAALTEYE